ncbi:MAG: formylmethanofuran dehydrogenase subunit C [Candidatus Bathyarchaeia archaeon]
MIRLYPSKEFRYPIFAECINPDVIQGKTISEIEALKVWEGNKQRKLGELFKIEMTSENDGNVTVQGDLSKVRKIGASMKNGEITIHGNVGMHLGEKMQGGKITVYGNVGGWAGSMMKGGVIEIHGNTSGYLGAPYRGCSEGMHGGKIIVHGNVGNEAGAYMRNGTIKVYGHAGQFAGLRMRDGTIYIQKDSETRVGACMKGGKIIVGGHIESVLPSFTIEGVKEKVKVEEGETAIGPFYLFVGDIVEHGDGKLYISKDKNPHLSVYEKFL